MTSAAAIKIQIALQSMGVISLGYVPTSRLAGSFVSSISSFGRKIVLLWLESSKIFFFDVTTHLKMCFLIENGRHNDMSRILRDKFR